MPGVWGDKDGSAFDALDRVVTRFSYPPNASCAAPTICSGPPTTTSNRYDGAAYSIGLLTASTDALGQL